jgi:hypothetical protein
MTIKTRFITPKIYKRIDEELLQEIEKHVVVKERYTVNVVNDLENRGLYQLAEKFEHEIESAWEKWSDDRFKNIANKPVYDVHDKRRLKIIAELEHLLPQPEFYDLENMHTEALIILLKKAKSGQLETR